MKFALHYYKNWQSLPCCFLNNFQQVVSFHPRNFNLWYCTSDGLQKVYITPFKHGHSLTWPFSVSFYKGISCQIWPFWSILGICVEVFGGTPKIWFQTFLEDSIFSTRKNNIVEIWGLQTRRVTWSFPEWLVPRFCLVVWIVQPIPSTYGLFTIFTCMWLIFMENEGRRIYQSHGSCARYRLPFRSYFCDWSQLHPTCKDFFEKIGHLVPFAYVSFLEG